MAELCSRMSAQEFGLWLEYLAEQPVEPAEALHRARVLEALHFPVRKPGGRMWTLADFFRRPWQPDEPVRPVVAAAPTAEQLRAQVAALCGITR